MHNEYKMVYTKKKIKVNVQFVNSNLLYMRYFLLQNECLMLNLTNFVEEIIFDFMIINE